MPGISVVKVPWRFRGAFAAVGAGGPEGTTNDKVDDHRKLLGSVKPIRLVAANAQRGRERRPAIFSLRLITGRVAAAGRIVVPSAAQQ